MKMKRWHVEQNRIRHATRSTCRHVVFDVRHGIYIRHVEKNRKESKTKFDMSKRIEKKSLPVELLPASLTHEHLPATGTEDTKSTPPPWRPHSTFGRHGWALLHATIAASHSIDVPPPYAVFVKPSPNFNCFPSSGRVLPRRHLAASARWLGSAIPSSSQLDVSFFALPLDDTNDDKMTQGGGKICIRCCCCWSRSAIMF